MSARNIEEDPDHKESGRIRAALEAALNRGGYGFHYAILRRLDALREQRRSMWRLDANEFPVRVQGVDTRVDFVLANEPGDIRLVVECKRVNPRLGRWCFAKSVYAAPYSVASGLRVERVRYWEHYGEIRAEVCDFGSSDGREYNLAVELKTNAPEDEQDPHGVGRGTIETAVTQALRGVNGLVESLHAYHQTLQGQAAALIPVVVTSAELWTTDVDLSNADLLSGRVEIVESSLHRRDWLVLQYHQSLSLRHESPRRRSSASSLESVLASDYFRSVVVTSPSGLEACLNWVAALPKLQ